MQVSCSSRCEFGVLQWGYCLQGQNDFKAIFPFKTKYISGQLIIFHQPRFPWNKGISLTKPPFGVRSCEVAIIWSDICMCIFICKNEIITYSPPKINMSPQKGTISNGNLIFQPSIFKEGGVCHVSCIQFFFYIRSRYEEKLPCQVLYNSLW